MLKSYELWMDENIFDFKNYLFNSYLFIFMEIFIFKLIY